MDVPRNASSLILPVRVVDDDGNAITGIAHNDASLTIEALKQGDSAYASVTLAAGTLGTYVSGGWVELGGGYYQFCPPNGLVVEGRSTAIRLTYATNKPQDGSINAVGSLSANETSSRIALDIVDSLNNWGDAVEEWATKIDILLSVSHGAGSWEGGASVDTETIIVGVLEGIRNQGLVLSDLVAFTKHKKISIVKGDDYQAADSRAWEMTVNVPDVDFTGATAEFGAGRESGEKVFGGSASVVDTGTVGQATLRIEFAAADTGDPVDVTPDDYRWTATILKSGRRLTVVGGAITVHPVFSIGS